MAFLDLIRQRIDAARADLPMLSDLAARMAQPLLAGGALFAPDLGTFWPYEFGGRAGGLMGLAPSSYIARSSNDVAFTTLPDPRRANPEDPRWRALIDSPAQIFINGTERDIPQHSAATLARRIQGFTGGAAATEGLYAKDALNPLIPLRPFDQLLRGWITTGELIAACTRAGKMPALWMSVWLEGALVRNASFFQHDNLLEPWHPPLFHDSVYIPPLQPLHVANAFLAELEKIFAAVQQQREKISTAGQWMAEALRANKRISTVLVGHSYPHILELKELKQYPLAWLPSVSDLSRAHPGDLSAGDVALHLGYSPVNVADVQRLLARGIRFIYTSPYGRPDALGEHPNLLWLDLPWRPGDATVDIPGYSVRALPMSSCAHTILYFALLSELAERMSWR